MKTVRTTSGEEVFVALAASGDYLVQVFDALLREHAVSLASEAVTALGIDGTWVLVEDYNDVSAGWWLTLRPDGKDVR